MRTLALIFMSAACAAAAPYSYSIYNPNNTLLQPSDVTNWNANSGATNGSISYGGQGAPGSLYSASAGSLIYTHGTIPTAYEVAANLDSSFTTAGGGAQLYLHASSNALRSSNGSSDTGTFDVISFYSPSCAGDGSCTINMAYYERTTSGTSLKASTVVPYLAGARVRAVAYSSIIGVLINQDYYGFSSGLTGGNPGVGVSLNSSGVIDSVQIGPLCPTVPTTVSASSVTFSAYPNSISLSWTEPVQPADVATIGIVEWYRAKNSAWDGQVATAAAFTDTSVAPDTSYTYSVAPVSFHGVAAAYSTAVTVETPDPKNIDPRRTGIKPLGTYWGASPEQVDVASGNLNLTVPLLQAQGRGGWTVPLSLSYNSQNWKKDSSGVEMSGLDVGYGQGWRLAVGSLTPYWNNITLGIDHYLFIDSTGAEYRLYQMSSSTPNIWTSQIFPASIQPSGEGIYVYYDSNAGLLHFRDGSFWVMDCTSGSEEPDAGALYPTVVEDRNGNQVSIAYEDGINTVYGNLARASRA